MMYGMKKSDEAIVPLKAANKGAQAPAESPEGRASTKGNSRDQSTHRTQGRDGVSQAVKRIRQAATTYFAYPRLPPPDGAETVADLVVARTLYFDRILERVLPEVEQFVLLGAGYDTRAYGPLLPDGVACFELDQPRV